MMSKYKVALSGVFIDGRQYSSENWRERRGSNPRPPARQNGVLVSRGLPPDLSPTNNDVPKVPKPPLERAA